MAGPRNQPQYDFLSASPGSAPQSAAPGTLRASIAVKADAGTEELRAHVYKLQYELDSFKQEREVTALRHEEDLRLVQSKADADFKRAQASESSSNLASARHEAATKELLEAQDRLAAEKQDLERQLRNVQSQASTLREELEEVQTTQAAQERQHKHEINEFEAHRKSIHHGIEELRVDRDEKAALLQTAQQRLSQREAEVGSLENEIMRLKAQTGDADTLAVIKRELSEQVAHIQKLESANTDQRMELKQFRKQQKVVEVVEEEKRVLEGKVKIMNDLRKELGEAQLQKQILEDERRSWTSYLEGPASLGDENQRFESPEELAKAFMQVRLEKVSLVEELGKVSPELSARDQLIQSLEEQTSKLNEEMDKLRLSSTAPDPKVRARLERQRALAVKEVEYLRAQLKTFDTEEAEEQPDKHDAAKTLRIGELEKLLDEHRAEIATLHAALTAAEEASGPPPVLPPAPPLTDPAGRTSPPRPAPQKRARSPSPSAATDSPHRAGALSRKNRALQADVAAQQTRATLAETALATAAQQLAAVQRTSRTRVLALRDNPTAAHAAVQASTLAALRAENEALLASTDASVATVPRAALERLRADLGASEAARATQGRKELRLKQIFGAKTLEFREAVASLLGWKLDFLPNGRVRVTSMFSAAAAAAAAGRGAGDAGVDGAAYPDSIEFDGERGTMKVSGGPNSAFASEIRGLIEFWVEGRKEIPCFLAAATLEFFERGSARVA